MEINENLVVEQETVNTAENVEQTTEQVAAPPKTYTQEQVDTMIKEKLDQVLPGKIARKEAKLRKEYDQRYGTLESVLKAGTGMESVEEMTESLRGFFQKQGKSIPDKPIFSDSDLETLAAADAQEIIEAGYDEVVAEVDRLAAVGIKNMSAREKTVFKTLAEYRHVTERNKALSEIGVSESVYNSPEFKAFAGQFKSGVPITEIHKMYEKTVNKPNVEAMGSMKTGGHESVKTYYSPEDVDKLSPEDFDNPVIFQRVRESMKQW